MEVRVISKIKYVKKIFNAYGKSKTIENLTIKYQNKNYLTTYNNNKYNVDGDRIDGLLDKIIELTGDTCTLNEYIDDCSATLTIYYEDNTKDEYDRGLSNEKTDLGTLLDSFISENINDVLSNNQIIERLLMEIDKLPNNTEITTARVCHSVFEDRIKEDEYMEIHFDLIKALKKRGYKIKYTIEGDVGMPYNIPFILTRRGTVENQSAFDSNGGIIPVTDSKKERN